MTPSRPYLLRGLHEWIVDNGLTPHLLVNAEGEGVSAPLEFADDGQLVLNISYTATRGLSLGNEAVAFEARFGGTPMQVLIPISEVLAIFARENGRGMVFSPEDGAGDPPSGDNTEPPDGSGGDGGNAGRPGLRVVK